MSFINYSNRLRQFVPNLSPEQAEDYINQAWRDIRDADDGWSFLHGTEYWLAPGVITLSGIAVTQNDDAVALQTADNVAALAGLNNPSLTQRQFRVGPGGGPIYSISDSDVQQVTDGQMTALSATLDSAAGPFSNSDVGLLVRVVGAGSGGTDLDTTIAAYVSPTQVTLADAAVTSVSNAVVSWGSTLTLDRLFRETSSSDATATTFRAYYSPESQDYTRLDCVYDPVTGYEFGWEIGQPEELNRMDPMRGAQGFPYRIFFREYDASTNLPVYELWPYPQAERAYTVQFWGRGTDFSEDTDALPPQIPEELLMLRARLLAYEWQLTNEPDKVKVGAILKAMDWVRSRYSTEGLPGARLGLLQQARRKDTNIYRKAYIRSPRRGPVGYPIDSNYLQQTDWGPRNAGLAY